MGISTFQTLALAGTLLLPALANPLPHAVRVPGFKVAHGNHTVDTLLTPLASPLPSTGRVTERKATHENHTGDALLIPEIGTVLPPGRGPKPAVAKENHGLGALFTSGLEITLPPIGRVPWPKTAHNNHTNSDPHHVIGHIVGRPGHPNDTEVVIASHLVGEEHKNHTDGHARRSMPHRVVGHIVGRPGHPNDTKLETVSHFVRQPHRTDTNYQTVDDTVDREGNPDDREVEIASHRVGQPHRTQTNYQTVDDTNDRGDTRLETVSHLVGQPHRTHTDYQTVDDTADRGGISDDPEVVIASHLVGQPHRNHTEHPPVDHTVKRNENSDDREVVIASHLVGQPHRNHTEHQILARDNASSKDHNEGQLPLKEHIPGHKDGHNNHNIAPLADQTVANPAIFNTTFDPSRVLKRDHVNSTTEEGMHWGVWHAREAIVHDVPLMHQIERCEASNKDCAPHVGCGAWTLNYGPEDATNMTYNVEHTAARDAIQGFEKWRLSLGENKTTLPDYAWTMNKDNSEGVAITANYFGINKWNDRREYEVDANWLQLLQYCETDTGVVWDPVFGVRYAMFALPPTPIKLKEQSAPEQKNGTAPGGELSASNTTVAANTTVASNTTLASNTPVAKWFNA